MKLIFKGPSQPKTVALTFDDGPTPGVTTTILDELKRRGLKATFFVIGERVAAFPQIVTKVVEDGHEIGNHTFNHINLNNSSEASTKDEILTTQEALRKIFDYHPRWMRPPYGAISQKNLDVVHQLGLQAVLWDVDSLDWQQPDPSKAANTVVRQTRPGSIVLCHDLYKQTSAMIPLIIDDLLIKGYFFKTISELMDER